MNEESQSIGQPLPPSVPEKKGMPTWAIVVVSVLAGSMLVAVLAYAFFAYKNMEQYQVLPVERTDTDSVLDTQTSSTPDMLETEVFETGEDAFGKFVRATKEAPKDYSTMFVQDPLVVNWFSHAVPVPESEATDIISKASRNYGMDIYTMKNYVAVSNLQADDSAPYAFFLYTLGMIEKPSQLAGRPVYLFAYPLEGMGIGISSKVVVYIDELQGFLALEENEYDLYNAYYSTSLFDINTYFIGATHYESGLAHPEKIQIPKTESTLIFNGSYKQDPSSFSDLGAQNNRGGIANIITGEILSRYAESDIEFTDPTYGPVYFIDGEYRLILKDGSVQTYELLPPFLSPLSNAEQKQMYPFAYDTDISWGTDFSQSKDMYQIGGNLVSMGCMQGVGKGTNVVSLTSWFSESDLVKKGSAKNGDSIFVLSNPENNPLYKQLFAYGGQAAYMIVHPEIDFMNFENISEEEMYAEFLANDPIIFWKDHKDRWRVYFKSEYQSMAECGKPVIYLYPEEAMDVNVKVAPNGGFTYTDPVYPENGWFVHATPEGTLYSYSEKASYPYLFWEGHADGFGFSEKGFVFSRDTLESDMTDLLAKAGLNKQETIDFLEFWLPKMQEKPYVFVTFANQRAFESSAPLKVTPAPDSVLRVFMNFKSLDTYTKVEPLLLRGFERKGFTVVEWGGILEKK